MTLLLLSIVLCEILTISPITTHLASAKVQSILSNVTQL